MPQADWRSPGVYQALALLDAPDFAWQFLKRNPEFRDETRKLADLTEQDSLSADAADEFARRWGVLFRAGYCEGDRDFPASLDSFGASFSPDIDARPTKYRQRFPAARSLVKRRWLDHGSRSRNGANQRPYGSTALAGAA